MRVDADARSERRSEAFHDAGCGHEAARRVFGIDPDLDRVAVARRAPGDRELPARGDAELLADDVDPGDCFADRMLDLQACI